MTTKNNFTFEGTPSCCKIEEVGLGYKLIFNASSIPFEFNNLKGKLDGDMIFFTNDKTKVSELSVGPVRLDGVLSKAATSGNRDLIVIKAEKCG